MVVLSSAHHVTVLALAFIVGRACLSDAQIQALLQGLNQPANQQYLSDDLVEWTTRIPLNTQREGVISSVSRYD